MGEEEVVMKSSEEIKKDIFNDPTTSAWLEEAIKKAAEVFAEIHNDRDVENMIRDMPLLKLYCEAKFEEAKKR
jgi:hypothetical protein